MAQLEDLFAFWEYDQFPYVSGAQISKINERGLVYAPSYQGWFNPVKIVSLECGIKTRQELLKLKKEYDLLISKVRKEQTEKVNKILNSINIKNIK